MEFKNQWDTDDESTSKETNKSEPADKSQSVDLEKIESIEEQSAPQTDESAVDLEKTNVATDNSPKQSDQKEKLASIYPHPTTPTFSKSFLAGRDTTDDDSDNSHTARRFLVAYVTTAFSALAILSGTAWLGYVLADHFLGPKSDSAGLFYLDLAPLYISIMASMTVFGSIYIVASRYVAKSASSDTIGLKDWRAYKVVYAFFSALLIATGASVIAGLVYIPLAQLMIADDLDAKRILVQTVASLHVLLWIGILIWQERLVKKAKQSWLQGFVVVAGVALVVIATGVFPVGSKTDERFDNRVASDLSTIQSAISDYKNDNKKLPASLTDLSFDEDANVKGRLSSYTYTVKSSDSNNQSGSEQSTQVNATVLRGGTSAEDMSDEEYYESLYESMYKSALKNTTASQQTYELCATFRTDTTDKQSDVTNAFSSALGVASSDYSFTSHKIGNVCFTRK